MNKKFIIILILNILFIVGNTTLAKYIFNDTLDVAIVNTTNDNYYIIKYTELNDTNEKIEKLSKEGSYDMTGEILKNWIASKSETLETIKIEDNSGYILDCSFLFGGLLKELPCKNLTKIDLSEFNTENVENMNFMFYGCPKLSELNISNFNTNQTNNMSYMFLECYELETLDLRSFSTNNVSYMDGMFAGCKSLKEVKVSANWSPCDTEVDIFSKSGVNHTTLYN